MNHHQKFIQGDAGSCWSGGGLRNRSVVPSHSTAEASGGWSCASCSNRTAPSASFYRGAMLNERRCPTTHERPTVLAGGQADVRLFPPTRRTSEGTWCTPASIAGSNRPPMSDKSSRRTVKRGRADVDLLQAVWIGQFALQQDGSALFTSGEPSAPSSSSNNISSKTTNVVLRFSSRTPRGFVRCRSRNQFTLRKQKGVVGERSLLLKRNAIAGSLRS